MVTAPTSGPPVSTGLATRIPLVIQVVVALTLILGLYSGVLLHLFKDWWTRPAFSQGILIPPLTLYVAWMRRSYTLEVPAEHDLRGLWLTAGACMLYLLGQLGAEFFLARTSFVVLLAGLAWTFWGLRRLRTLAFPLLLLATMVPLPALIYNTMTGPLQLFASSVATTIAQALGISVYQEGNMIHLAHISLGVEEACSGLNSLSALVVTSLLLALLICVRKWARVSLILLSVPLAIAVNILRVTCTAILADYHEEFALGFYHTFSGWVVFVVGFGCSYLAAKALHASLD